MSIPAAKETRRVALIGTAGDPIHIGHLIMAENILRAKAVHEVFYVPSGMRQDKPGLKTSAADRLRIGEAMLEGLSNFGFRHAEQIKFCNMEGPECQNGVDHTIPSFWLMKKFENTYNNYCPANESFQAQPLKGKSLEALRPQPSEAFEYVFYWTLGTDCMDDIKGWTDSIPGAELQYVQVDGKEPQKTWKLADGRDQSEHDCFEHDYGKRCFEEMRWICVARPGYNNDWYDTARHALEDGATGLQQIGGLLESQRDKVPPQAYITIAEDALSNLEASSSDVRKLLLAWDKERSSGHEADASSIPATVQAFLTPAGFEAILLVGAYNLKQVKD